jgi:hypothetical protein
MFVRCETNSNKGCASDTGAGVADPEALQNGARSLFTAGVIAVVVGLLLPLPAHILDVLLIFSVSLTAAVLIITFSARGALQVQGFPLLIVLATMLRMALSVACSRMLLSRGNGGTIINLFGNMVVRNNLLFAILVFGALAIVIFRTICKAVKGIRRAATEFTADIVPIKENRINSDLKAGVINESDAFNLRSKTAREAVFFVAMASAARFIFFAAVIELVIVIVNIVASIAMGIVSGATVVISIKTYTTLAIGAGMITQIPALVAAVASGYLVRKSFASSATHKEPGEQAAPQSACPSIDAVKFRAEPVEYIDAELTEIINPAASSNIETEPCFGFPQSGVPCSGKLFPAKAGTVIAEEADWLDKQTDEENGKDCNLWLWKDKEPAGQESYECNDYYEAIAELIENKSANVTKTILMAAKSAEELPVTIPVNIAIRLAQRNQKCLLIDLDLKRGAISKVFDIDSVERSNRMRGEATATCISNLWVWQASNFNKGDGDTEVTNIKDIIAGLESRYECLIIYAPNIELADKCRITDCVGAAMLFGSKSKFESSSINDCYTHLISCGWEILKPTEVFAGAV